MANLSGEEDSQQTPPKTTNTLQKTVDFVNHQLASAGFPATLDFSGFFGNFEDASQILNCICTLLQQRQKDVAYREDLQHRLRRAASDNEDLSTTIAKLKARLEQCSKEVDLLNNKFDTAQKSLKKESEKHNAAKEELKTAKANLQYSKTQYNHDLRKKERDFHRLKERLQKIAIEQATAQKMSIKLANPLPKTTTTATTTKKTQRKQEDEMYNVVIQNYEEREKELLAENQNLRDTLFNVFSNLKNQFTEKAELGEDSGTVSHRNRTLSEEAAAIEKAHFQLPFNLNRHSVELRIKDAMAKLKNEWARLSDNLASQQEIVAVEELQAQTRELEHECEEYRKIIEEQNRLLELSLSQQSKQGEGMSESTIDMSMIDVQEQRAEVERKSRELDEQRQKFTDAAIKLGLERAALQREKIALEEERRSLSTQVLLEKLPDTPGWLREKCAGQRPEDTSPLRNRSGTPPARTVADDEDTTTSRMLFIRSLSSVKPTRHIQDHSSSNEIIMESDTLTDTPRFESRNKIITQKSPVLETPGNNKTISSLQSTIKSALKKQPSTGGSGRSVRIAVHHEAEKEERSFRPGEVDNRENAGPKAVEPMRKGFLATSTPNSVRSDGVSVAWTPSTIDGGKWRTPLRKSERSRRGDPSVPSTVGTRGGMR